MRWLLDQGLPRSVATLLNATTHDALHVGEIGLAEASDVEILQYAVRDHRVIVTLDADFHALLALTASSRPTVIRIREEGLKGPAVTALLLRISRQFESELQNGCMMTYLGENIRFRRLPLT